MDEWGPFAIAWPIPSLIDRAGAYAVGRTRRPIDESWNLPPMLPAFERQAGVPIGFSE